jgi:hypothetical protein
MCREVLGAFDEESPVLGGVPLVMATVSPQAAAGSDAFWLTGRATVRRLGRWKFPAFELGQDGDVLARMGRTGWIKVYLGSGQRVELPNGDRWTIRSIGIGGTFSPIIVDSSGRKVALAGMSHGSYGINGKDYSCVLAPVDEPMIGRANTWALRRFEDEIATITRYPLSVDASVPVHLGAVLMSFVLVRYGLPEESMPRIPAFRW